MYNLPPTKKGREYEIHAIGLRDFAGLKRDDQRLNPFDLARYVNLLVVPFREIEPSLPEETKAHLTGVGKDDWSGVVVSLPLPDGKRLVILNPTHSKNRRHATLMEEICHVFLEHKPSRLAIKDPEGENIIARDYNAKIEEEAYSIGAAALVPYTSLCKFVRIGKTSREIAEHFDVSYQLVEYRIKVSRIWREYISIQGSKATI